MLGSYRTWTPVIKWFNIRQKLVTPHNKKIFKNLKILKYFFLNVNIKHLKIKISIFFIFGKKIPWSLCRRKKNWKIVFPSDYNLSRKQKTSVVKRELYLPRPLYLFLWNWLNFFQNWPNFVGVLAGKPFQDLATLPLLSHTSIYCT